MPQGGDLLLRATNRRPRCNNGRRKLAPPVRCNRFPCTPEGYSIHAAGAHEFCFKVQHRYGGRHCTYFPFFEILSALSAGFVVILRR
jgi:hypothetical protein